ncbi:SRPBCC family protein [Aquincola sp. S2]|uniref:SRPBCC family protein n=1 Tax=Pseudaquabacterium terrae TaxID=2732868 RepID=A0ABX2E9E0_9BURK|nr:SRPBCC family protein [Aquabacterium terrae]NRF65586.1 SRPBCC family protein [Aquabacterium terrae]
MSAHTVQTTIARPWREVCDFLGQAPNFARWASWIGPTLQRRHGGDWVARRADGAEAKVRFTERNAFGIADHCVLESAERASFVALRALPHGDDEARCEVLLTLFAEPPAPDGLAVRAAAAVRDLAQLKALIERP